MNELTIDKLIEKCNSLEELLTNLNIYTSNYNLIDTLQNIKDEINASNYKISIVAQIKAGKSSLINAFLGKDLLPNESDTCTAAITEVINFDNDDISVTKILNDGTIEKIEANENIEVAFHNDVRNSRQNSDYNNIEKYIVKAPILPLKNSKLNSINFTIVDTPGTNEYSEGEQNTIKSITLNQLRNSDALIVLLDYGSYKSEGNKEILEELSNNSDREDFKNEFDKVHFVINKIDIANYKDKNLEDIKLEAMNIISKYYPKDKIPKIYTVSAKQALLSRCILNNTANDDMKKEIKKFSSDYTKVMIDENGDEWEVIPKIDVVAQKVLDKSNIKELEENVLLNTYLESQKYKFAEYSDNINQILNTANMEINSLKISLTKDTNILTSNRELLKKYINDLRNLETEITSIGKSEIENMKTSVNNLIDSDIETMSSMKISNKTIPDIINRLEDKLDRYLSTVDFNLKHNINTQINSLIKSKSKLVSKEIGFIPIEFNFDNLINERIKNIYPNWVFYGTDSSSNKDNTTSKITFDSCNLNSFSIKTGLLTLLAANAGAIIGSSTLVASSTLATGVLLGSIVPGIGSIIGGVVGGLAGVTLGKIKENKNSKEILENRLKEIKRITNEYFDNIKIEYIYNLIDLMNAYINIQNKSFEDRLLLLEKDENEKLLILQNLNEYSNKLTAIQESF